MKPKYKLKRKNTHIHHTHNTKDDFVDDFKRWLRKKQALKKQPAEKQIANTSYDIAQALMVWADDGGAIVISQPSIKTIEQNLIIRENNHE
ncbi:MAG: hypothetical protein H6654_03560 [Ardenticatenaceae bacterium]|nr:hypothetical protein [Ardenticatenaceae bacterium]